GADMAFDANTGSIVLFGGMGASGPLRDTWTWDGSTWTQQHPAHDPPPTFLGPRAYDPASHDVVLLTVTSPPVPSGPISSSSGADRWGPASGQTWLWDGADWHTAPGAQPPVMGSSRLATDTAAGDVILVTTAAVPQPALGLPCRIQ